MKPAGPRKTVVVDPVCKMRGDSRSDSLKLDRNKKTHYFCAVSCRDAFRADPEKFLHAPNPKRKGILRPYLDRLQKTTGGCPPKCH